MKLHMNFIDVTKLLQMVVQHSQSSVWLLPGSLWWRLQSPSTALNPCSEPLKFWPPVTSHCTLVQLHLFTLYEACLCPFYPPPRTRTLFYSSALCSHAPHVGTSPKSFKLFHHSYFPSDRLLRFSLYPPWLYNIFGKSFDNTTPSLCLTYIRMPKVSATQVTVFLVFWYFSGWQ